MFLPTNGQPLTLPSLQDPKQHVFFGMGECELQKANIKRVSFLGKRDGDVSSAIVFAGKLDGISYDVFKGWGPWSFAAAVDALDHKPRTVSGKPIGDGWRTEIEPSR